MNHDYELEKLHHAENFESESEALMNEADAEAQAERELENNL